MFKKSKRRLRLLSMSIVLSMMTQMGASVVFAKENDAAFLSCSDDLVYEVTENRQSLWDGHMVVEYTVKNSGNKEINDWNFLVNIPYDIESIWNAQKLESDGAYYQIGNYGWNSTIQPGQSITFGMTLSGIQDTSNIESPTTWLLNSARKALASDNLSVTYTEYSNWGSGFNGVLKITNNANTAINDWSFDITTNRPITSVSNAVFKDNGNNSYTLSNAGYNAKINAHSSIEININGGSNDKSSFSVSIVNATESAAAFSLKGDNDKNGVPDYQEYIQGKLPDIPVVSPTPTSTPVPTATPTSTPVPTATSTPVPTSTPTSTPVPTATSTPVPTSTPTSTPVPTATSTPVPTMTPTDTPAPTATSTPVPTMTPTDTPAPTATSTPVPTMTPTDTPAPTATSTPVPTMTPTDTPAPTATSTPVPTMTPTGTPTPTVTSTPTPTPAVVGADSDFDGLLDADEAIWGTDPLNPDTDGDTILDGDEVRLGKNPLDPSDKDLKVEQTLTIDINNDEDQAVKSISVTMNLAYPIDRVLTIKDVYQSDWYTRDLYSRLGSPVSFECAEEFDKAKVVFHYAEGFLDDTSEDDLGVLWYDEANCSYIEQEQAVVDKEANTLSMEVSHFSTYAMHDKIKWKTLKFPKSNHYFYAHVQDTYSVVKGQTLDMDAAERWVYFWYSLSLSGDVKKVVKISRSAEFKEYWGYEEVYTITCDWLIFMEYDEDENGVYDFLEDGTGHMATNGHVYTNPEPFDLAFVTLSDGILQITKGNPGSTESYIPDDSQDKWAQNNAEHFIEGITSGIYTLKKGVTPVPVITEDEYYGIDASEGWDKTYTFYYHNKDGKHDLLTADDMSEMYDLMIKFGYYSLYESPAYGYMNRSRNKLLFDETNADSYDFDGDGIPDYKDTNITQSNGNAVRYFIQHVKATSKYRICTNDIRFLEHDEYVIEMNQFEYLTFTLGEYSELFDPNAQRTDISDDVYFVTIGTTAKKLDYDGDGIPDYRDKYITFSNGKIVRYCIRYDKDSSKYSIYVNHEKAANLVATLDSDDYRDFQTGRYSVLYGSDAQKQVVDSNTTYITIDRDTAENLDYECEGLPDYLDPHPWKSDAESGESFRSYDAPSGFLPSSAVNKDVLFICDLTLDSYYDHINYSKELNNKGLSTSALYNLSIEDYKTVLDEPKVCVFSMHGAVSGGISTHIYIDVATPEQRSWIIEEEAAGRVTRAGIGESNRIYRINLTKEFFKEYYGLSNQYGNRGLSDTVILSETCSFFGDGNSIVEDTALAATLYSICGCKFIMGFQESVGRGHAFNFVKHMLDLYASDSSRATWYNPGWAAAFDDTADLLGIEHPESDSENKREPWISTAMYYPKASS